MKRLIGLVVVLGVLFYVAWPAWSGYQLREAFERRDAALIERKVDFPSVRASLKPVLTGEIEKQVDRQLQQAGSIGGALAPQIKQDLLPKLVEAVVDAVVTPPSLMTIYHEGRNLREAIDRAIRERTIGIVGLPRNEGQPAGSADTMHTIGNVLKQLGIDPGKILGEPGQPPPGQPGTAPAPSAARPRAEPGLANIKSLRIIDPLAFEVGLARDPGAARPDVIAGLSFTGFDWKLTKLVPAM